jgi:hypothetical protein
LLLFHHYAKSTALGFGVPGSVFRKTKTPKNQNTKTQTCRGKAAHQIVKLPSGTPNPEPGTPNHQE